MDDNPLDEADAMWTRNAIKAYLDGEHNLSWIIGVIEAADDVEAARIFLGEMVGYGDAERRDDLRRRLEVEGAA